MTLDYPLGYPWFTPLGYPCSLSILLNRLIRPFPFILHVSPFISLFPHIFPFFLNGQCLPLMGELNPDDSPPFLWKAPGSQIYLHFHLFHQLAGRSQGGKAWQRPRPEPAVSWIVPAAFSDAEVHWAPSLGFTVWQSNPSTPATWMASEPRTPLKWPSTDWIRTWPHPLPFPI